MAASFRSDSVSLVLYVINPACMQCLHGSSSIFSFISSPPPLHAAPPRWVACPPSWKSRKGFNRLLPQYELLMAGVLQFWDGIPGPSCLSATCVFQLPLPCLF